MKVGLGKLPSSWLCIIQAMPLTSDPLRSSEMAQHETRIRT